METMDTLMSDPDRWTSDLMLYATMARDHWDEKKIDAFAECLAGPPGLSDQMLLDMMNDFLEDNKFPFKMIAIDTRRSPDQYFWRIQDVRPNIPIYSYNTDLHDLI